MLQALNESMNSTVLVRVNFTEIPAVEYLCTGLRLVHLSRGYKALKTNYYFLQQPNSAKVLLLLTLNEDKPNIYIHLATNGSMTRVSPQPSPETSKSLLRDTA